MSAPVGKGILYDSQRGYSAATILKVVCGPLDKASQVLQLCFSLARWVSGRDFPHYLRLPDASDPSAFLAWFLYHLGASQTWALLSVHILPPGQTLGLLKKKKNTMPCVDQNSGIIKAGSKSWHGWCQKLDCSTSLELLSHVMTNLSAASTKRSLKSPKSAITLFPISSGSWCFWWFCTRCQGRIQRTSGQRRALPLGAHYLQM